MAEVGRARQTATLFLVFECLEPHRGHSWGLMFSSQPGRRTRATDISDLKPGEAGWKPKEACFITLRGALSTSNAAFYMDESDLANHFAVSPQIPRSPVVHNHHAI